MTLCTCCQLTCTVVATNKKRTIPVIIRVSDINDNPPVFVKTPYHTSVSEGSYQTSVLELSLTNLELQGSYQTRVLEGSLTNLELQGSYQTSVLEVSLTNLELQGSYQTRVLEGSYQTRVLEVSLTNFELQGSYQTSVLEVSLTNLELQGPTKSASWRLYKELALFVGIKLDIRYPYVFNSGSGTAVPESSGRENKLLLLPVYSMRRGGSSYGWRGICYTLAPRHTRCVLVPWFNARGGHLTVSVLEQGFARNNPIL
uniref:Cadherin domain-containing protein n=1 Tax=Timema poppense TaxID=170557 RepID=A0A7R9CWF3_TIMPO|nr:unnamed protein product [Timema poppensis]